MNKNTMIKLLSVLLCFVMCVTILPMRAEAATPSISKSSLTMCIGNKVTLKVKNTTKTPTWKSSKPSVASVSGKGVVTAKKNGITTVSAKIGTKTYKCKVTVQGNPVLELSAMTLTKGKSRSITLFGATAKSFSSSNPKVVKITSKKGNACTVKALKKGTATITVKDKEGRKYQCTVTVISNGNFGGNSSDVQFSGSVTLPNLGITIKTPNQYNSNGNLYTEIGDNANAFTNVVNQTLGDAQGMAWVGNAYGFYTMGYNSSPCSEITYNGDGTYTLIIGAHFGGGYQSMSGPYDITGFNADAIICELSTMSSTPMTVYNGIYDILYGTNIYDVNTWYTFGDCKIKGSPTGSMDPMSQVFYIKKK